MLIPRKSAITAIWNEIVTRRVKGLEPMDEYCAEAILTRVKSAEQRRGHWDKDGKCDQCGEYPPFCYQTEYCPHCGAKMEEHNEKN